MQSCSMDSSLVDRGVLLGPVVKDSATNLQTHNQLSDKGFLCTWVFVLRCQVRGILISLHSTFQAEGHQECHVQLHASSSVTQLASCIRMDV